MVLICTQHGLYEWKKLISGVFIIFMGFLSIEEGKTLYEPLKYFQIPFSI